MHNDGDMPSTEDYPTTAKSNMKAPFQQMAKEVSGPDENHLIRTVQYLSTHCAQTFSTEVVRTEMAKEEPMQQDAQSAFVVDDWTECTPATVSGCRVLLAVDIASVQLTAHVGTSGRKNSQLVIRVRTRTKSAFSAKKLFAAKMEKTKVAYFSANDSQQRLFSPLYSFP